MKIRADKEAASRIPEFIMRERRFVCFKELPTELRRMIWKLAAREPRVVEFSYYQRQKTMASKFPSKTMVSAILHTSSEARTCGLEVYVKLDFGSLFDSTYINWEIDIVTFETIHALKSFLEIEDGIYVAADPRRPSPAAVARGRAKTEPRLIHSPINLKCRRLAVTSRIPCVDLPVLDIAKMKRFPQLDEFILARCTEQPKTFHQGNGNMILSASTWDWHRSRLKIEYDDGTFYEALVEEEDCYKDYENRVNAIMRNYGKIAKGSVMVASRDNYKFFTPEEKKERQKVKEGKMALEEAQALKAQREEANKTPAQKKKEEQERLKQKQFEEDLILLAMYVPSRL